jgi:hypothetical protein
MSPRESDVDYIRLTAAVWLNVQESDPKAKLTYQGLMDFWAALDAGFTIDQIRKLEA